jgi:hypothetical protein
LIAKIISWLYLVSSSPSRRLNISEIHKDKITSLLDDENFRANLENLYFKVMANSLIGTKRIPPKIAEYFWRVLEKCKGESSNYEWFRNYVKAHGKLENRLKSAKGQVDFCIPMVPAFPQDNTEWARIMKKNMLMAASVLHSAVKVPKSHNDWTKYLLKNFTENNDEFFKECFKALEETESSKVMFESVIVDFPREKLEEEKIIMVLLDKTFFSEKDLLRLIDELKIPLDFTY